MKNKIILSHLDEKNGYSCVAVKNKYGTFWGHAFCSDEDMENYSQYAGERYALLRAEKNFAKFRLKQEKIKLKTIQNLKKEIEQDKTIKIPPHSKIMRKINLKLRDYTQSVSDWENLYHYYEPEIKHQDALRQEILSRSKRNKLSK